ncbi:MAG: hypothetical protein J2P45_11235 [Candidatus Dormibacteraeota bacterium]|nr:hypothetical protein [Candidatus Dormibacteraeota bacterium]
MNRARAASGLFLLLLALAGCSTAPAGPSRTSLMKVAYNFKAGQTYRYHYTSTLNATMTMGSAPASPLKAESSADETWKVVSIDAGGEATIDETMSNLKTTVTGSMLSGSTSTTTNTTTTTTTQHIQFQVTPAGEILSGGSTSVPPLALATGQGLGPPGTDQFLAVLPDHAVKPGDTWTKTYTRSSPFGQGSVSYTTENRFLRYDDLPSGQAAVIQTTATQPLDLSTDLGQAVGGTGGAAPGPLPAGSPGSGTVSMQGTYKTNTTTWFDVKTDQVARMITADDIDQTTNFSGIAGLPSPPLGIQVPPGLPSPPPGVQVPSGLQGLLGPQHFVGRQTSRLDSV